MLTHFKENVLTLNMKQLGPELQDWEFEVTLSPQRVEREVQDLDPHAMNKILSYKRSMAFLKIMSDDEGVMCMRAWLPETRKEHSEVGMFLKGPIYSPCRGAIMRANEFCDRPHIVVMSKGVEEEILKLMNSSLLTTKSRIKCTIYSQKDENMSDGAKDSSGDYDVV